VAAPAQDLVVSQDLPFTGERFIPGVQGEIWLEHWHRYHFAARWAAGKRVLDVACGEGYGSALLASRAAHVTGVDVSDAAVAHARAAYGERANLEFVQASCTALPFPDASFDTVASFETLEHIEAQAAFLDQVARVLKPGGVFVLSCPNKAEYSDKRDFANEFHVKELYRAELTRLVTARFPEIAWYGQRPTFYDVIAPEGSAGAGELFEATLQDPARAAPALSAPLYFLLIAGRDRAAVESIAAPVSVLADQDDVLYSDYAKVIRELRASAARIAELEGKAAADSAALAAKQGEIDRRGGLRWWLRLPLHRFGLLK
jgi:SAM-dependent methyltransferase